MTKKRVIYTRFIQQIMELPEKTLYFLDHLRDERVLDAQLREIKLSKTDNTFECKIYLLLEGDEQDGS